jgi:hypothetical protein
MSFGMFLSLCFSAPGLEAFGSALHASFVRYFGLGRTVMCLHQDGIHPSAVAMPRIRVSYSLNAQLMWLKQEAAELCQVRRCHQLRQQQQVHRLEWSGIKSFIRDLVAKFVSYMSPGSCVSYCALLTWLPFVLQESNEAFDVLESALQNHPYFRTQAAAAAAASAVASPQSAGLQLNSPASALDVTPAAAAAYTAVGDGSGSSTPNSTALENGSTSTAAAAAGDAAAGSGSSSSSGGALLVSMSAMLSAVRKDRISFMDKVAEAVQRATPETPTRESAGGLVERQVTSQHAALPALTSCAYSGMLSCMPDQLQCRQPVAWSGEMDWMSNMCVVHFTTLHAVLADR